MNNGMTVEVFLRRWENRTPKYKESIALFHSNIKSQKLCLIQNINGQ